MTQPELKSRFVAGQHISLFLDDPPETPLSLGEAHTIAEHLTQCESCAKAISESAPHHDLLLEILQTGGDAAEAKPDDATTKAFDELHFLATRVVRTLDSQVRAKLENFRGSTSPEVTRLQGLGLSTLEARCALAVAETSLALQSLVLRSPDGHGKLTVDGTIKVGSTTIPSGYLPSRISDRIGVNIELATTLCTVIVRLTVAGGVGLPRLAMIDRAQDYVLLAFDQSAGPLH